MKGMLVHFINKIKVGMMGDIVGSLMSLGTDKEWDKYSTVLIGLKRSMFPLDIYLSFASFFGVSQFLEAFAQNTHLNHCEM